jgi:hypothetical protein
MPANHIWAEAREDWKKKENQHMWALPSLAELKRLMMMVREQREEAKAVARIARQDIVREYSHSAIAALVQARLHALRDRLSRRGCVIADHPPVDILDTAERGH